MNNWKTSKLKDVCDRVTVGFVGSMAHQYQETGVPFFRSQNITPFRLNLDGLKYVSKQFHEKIRKSALRPGDVAVVRTGYPGTACVIPQELKVSNCSDLVIIRPGKQLNPYFLCAIFNSTFGRDLVGGNLVGAAQQHFNITVAKELKFLLPSRAVQDKIAAILSAYDELIENNQRRIAPLEKVAEEIYREWFVRLRFPGHEKVKKMKGVPSGWEVRLLSSFASEIKRGVKKKNLGDEEKYLGLEHIPRRSISIKEWATADTVDSDKLLFQKRDILFGKIRPYLHKVALAHFSGACSSDTIVLRPKERIYQGHLLFTVFSDTFIELATIASKGTKMPRADWGFLKKLELAVPDAKLLEAFRAQFEVLFSQIVNLLRANEALTASRDQLLPRLVSGKLSVENLDIQFPPGMEESAREV